MEPRLKRKCTTQSYESTGLSASKKQLSNSSKYFSKNNNGSGNEKTNGVAKKLKYNPDKFGRTFYEVPCEELAKSLLGKRLVRILPSGERLCGKIVETEAYLGPCDKAAHSFLGKRTERNEAMYMQPGTAYVYNIYGMYCCLNISSQGPGAAVLIRGIEPMEGLIKMREFRSVKSTKPLKDKDIANGPSKIAQAFNISKEFLNRMDLVNFDKVWIEKGETIPNEQIVACKRIGIDYAGDWASKKLRFYIIDNQYISVKNKEADDEQYISVKNKEADDEQTITT